MPYTHYHPVYLDLNRRKILIVGGGAVAIEKIESLLPSGGLITVISPDVRPEIENWSASGAIEHLQRTFQPSDVDCYYMVIAATDDPQLNELVYHCGNSKQRLTNSVDDPLNCNFIMSAITRRGPMQVAVSSAGCSPALAQRVRNRIMSEVLTEDLGELAEFLGDHRPQVKASLPGYKVRQAFWERVIDSPLPDLLAEHRLDEAQTLFDRMLARAVAAAPSDFESDPGKVFLVGAGPGDPELITLKALRALQSADVVLYDRLVNPKLLDHAPSKAERIYVGKELGRSGKGRQAEINRLMVAHAAAGQTVVRLKGGDPFVFGRGGEEMIALHAAGVPFEVVPGISSALAGAASANIPVTHRGVSTGFAVFAGQEANGQDEVPWAAAAQIPTCVFLMGVDRLPHIVERLLHHGRNPSTPAAVISNATLPNQRQASGTLETIVREAATLPAPAVIVVGDVVSISKQVLGVDDLLITHGNRNLKSSGVTLP